MLRVPSQRLVELGYWLELRVGRARRFLAAMVVTRACPDHPAAPGGSPGSGPAERTWIRLLQAADHRPGGVERDHSVHFRAGRQR